MSRPILAATLSAVFVLAVPVASGAAAAKRPCALVTGADATKVLGVLAGPKKEQNFGLYQSCTYEAKGSKSLTVQSRQVSRADFVKSAKANPGPVKHIAGIGSDAYSAGGGSTLLIWKKGTGVTLLIVGVGDPLAAEKQLARVVVGRL